MITSMRYLQSLSFKIVYQRLLRRKREVSLTPWLKQLRLWQKYSILSLMYHRRKAVSLVESSPMKYAQLRCSSLEDLKTLKALYEDGVISQTEFAERKDGILSTLKSLHDK